MKHAFLLLPVLALAGRAAAQTTPAATPPASASWYIFNRPLSEDEELRSRRANRSATLPRPPGPATPLERRTRRNREFQGTLFVPLDPNTYRLIDRYAIKYGPDSTQDPHTSERPYTRGAVASLAERMRPAGGDSVRLRALSAVDRFNAEYLLQDNWMYSPLGDSLNVSKEPALTYFYREQTDLYSVRTHDFALRVNPVLGLQAGKDMGGTSITGLRYVNTRGAAFEGLIDQRLGFYGFFTDNQTAVPYWVQYRTLRDTIAPHEGYLKPYKSATLGAGSSAYDFFTARGGITYAATRHINVQLAHDRNFIGNGYRSLILSDYSAPYFFLKLSTRVWKFSYQNLFAELVAQPRNADQVYPKKYLALHHLSFDFSDNFNLGLFESEVSGGPGRGLELQYLNPVIFYRAIEQQVGSADNALLGLDFKWNIAHRGQLYGQLVLDEFKLSEVRAGNGWYANKQAVQLGGKLLDVAGVPNLDVQLEFNYVRPFTYQHTSYYTSYTDYNQPLAHPMGANLSEVLAIVSYQPLPRLSVVGKLFYTRQGLSYTDRAGRAPYYDNYGANPLLPYTVLPKDASGNDIYYGYRVGSGNLSQLWHFDLTATYQPRLNLFVEGTLIARHQSIEQPIVSAGNVPLANSGEVYAALTLRWNIAQRLHEF